MEFAFCKSQGWVAGIVLAGAFSGCMSESSFASEIPLPTEGAVAVYENLEGKQVEFRVGGVIETALPGYGPRALLNVQQIGPEDDVEGLETRIYYVDPGSNTAVGTATDCPVKRQGGCDGRYRFYDYATSGQPWGLGSSIFQGRSLTTGGKFSSRFPQGHEVIQVEFHILDAWKESARTLFVVEGVSEAKGALGEFHGTWLVASDGPFVVSYEARYDAMALDGSVATRDSKWTLVRFSVADQGPSLALGHAAYSAPAVPETAGPLIRGLPTGAEAPIGWGGLSMRSVWDHLQASEPRIGRAAESGVARIVSLLVPATTSSAVFTPYREDTVVSELEFATGELSEVWEVPWVCRGDAVTGLTTQCEFRQPRPKEPSQVHGGRRANDFGFPFQEAWAKANATAPRAFAEFRILADTNMIRDEAHRDEFLVYSFMFPLTTPEGANLTSRGIVQIDGLFGTVRQALVESTG